MLVDRSFTFGMSCIVVYSGDHYRSGEFGPTEALYAPPQAHESGEQNSTNCVSLEVCLAVSGLE